MRYPPTRRDATEETLHGHRVSDPYRWLEDPDSEETKAWVAEQNAFSRPQLDGLGTLPWFRETMRAIVGRPRASTPDKVGGRYLVSRNDGTRQQPVWYVADSLDELVQGGRVLLDPNTFSEDGTSSLFTYNDSRDGRWLAYLVSDGGSDWTSIRVLDLESGQDRPGEVLRKVKFSEATWLPDHTSFLYLYFPVAGSGVGTESAELPGGQLRRHRLGRPQDEDDVVLEFPENPRLSAVPELSEDGRWLVVSIHEGTSEKNRLWVYPVETDDGASTIGAPLKIVDEAVAGFAFVRVDEGTLTLHTDHQAPLGRVVRLDLPAFADGGRADLVDVVREGEWALRTVRAAGDEILAVHLVDVQPRITRHALDGTELGTVDVAGGSVVAVNARAGEEEVFLGLSSVTQPVVSHRLDLATGDLREVTGLEPVTQHPWTAPPLVTERRRAVSGDGTLVPYFAIRRTDVDTEGPRPTLLYGYGGFDIPLYADYRPVFAGWLAAGGVLAIANLRGGGEYGTTWHEAGRLHQKQNVFDDFAAVADHLVAEGVTTHGQLALHGGSNGGLLVGATVAQRPDIAAVALPAVGVLDMLRFHLFTIGSAWVADYGSPDDPEMFETLLAYSPLHRLMDGESYPATLVLTGDHDDRVVPAHSFKFVARMQQAQGGSAPVLARIETSTGHGLGKPLSTVVEETADMLAYAAEHTGLQPG